MRNAFLLLALAVALTGCINFGEKATASAITYYVLDDPAGVAGSVPPKPDAPTLLVFDTTAGSFYDTDQLIFSRSAGTRGQYQFARWTERPGRRFADLMRARLDRQGTWNITATSGHVRGDLLLDTELVEFYHDAADEPGHVRLVLRAELVDLKRRTLLGRQVFEQKVGLTTYDAAGVAQASNIAVGRALDDLTAWLTTVQ